MHSMLINLFMTLVIDTVDGRSFSNEVFRQLLPEKTKVKLYYLFISKYVRSVLPVLQYYKDRL